MPLRKNKKKDIYVIYIADPDMSVDEALIEHRYEFSKHIVETIIKGIDEGKDKVDIAEININDKIIIPLISSDYSYIDTLEHNIKILSEHEDYETCLVAKKYVDYLKNIFGSLNIIS